MPLEADELAHLAGSLEARGLRTRRGSPARTRCCRGPAGGAAARSAGRPSRSGRRRSSRRRSWLGLPDVLAVEQDLAERSARSGGSGNGRGSTCRCPTGPSRRRPRRAGRRTRRRGRRPSPPCFVTRSLDRLGGSASSAFRDLVLRGAEDLPEVADGDRAAARRAADGLAATMRVRDGGAGLDDGGHGTNSSIGDARRAGRTVHHLRLARWQPLAPRAPSADRSRSRRRGRS